MTKEKDDLSPNDLLKAVIARIWSETWQYEICELMMFEEHKENDLTALTAQEIIDKIRKFLEQNPSDVNKGVFLRLLAHYPVSMCKREVSPFLKKLMAIHYNAGDPNNFGKNEHNVSKIGYDDLSQIYVRSKATISQYVNDFKDDWADAKSMLDQELIHDQAVREEAEKQLIEEAKQRIKQETEGQTNERTTE